MNACIKKAIFFVVVSGLAMWLLINYADYISIKRKNNLSYEEVEAVCDEFSLEVDKKNIDYIYRQGSDRYGVRLLVSDYSATYIYKVLRLKLNHDSLQSYLFNDNWSEYKTSESKTVLSKQLISSFSDNVLENPKIYVFEENGQYYLEIEKSSTDNVTLFSFS